MIFSMNSIYLINLYLISINFSLFVTSPILLFTYFSNILQTLLILKSCELMIERSLESILVLRPCTYPKSASLWWPWIWSSWHKLSICSHKYFNYDFKLLIDGPGRYSVASEVLLLLKFQSICYYSAFYEFLYQ